MRRRISERPIHARRGRMLDAARNPGLLIQTNGILPDVAPKKSIDLGWIGGPRVVCAGHATTPTDGHLDPRIFQAFAPHVLPMTVEEGIADGVDEAVALVERCMTPLQTSAPPRS